MIRFSCTTCGRNIQANDADAGRRGKCPGCGSVFAIPAATQDDTIPFRDDDQPQVSSPPPSAARTVAVQQAPPSVARPAEVRQAPPAASPAASPAGYAARAAEPATSRFGGKKRLILIGVTIVVLLGAVAGWWFWANRPERQRERQALAKVALINKIAEHASKKQKPAILRAAAFAYAWYGQKKPALDTFDANVEKGQSTDEQRLRLLALVGEGQLRAGDKGGAIRTADEVIEQLVKLDRKKLAYLAGDIYVKAGDLKGIDRTYRDFAHDSSAAACAKVEAGDIDAALQDAKSLIPNNQVEVYCAIGRVREKAGDKKGAADAFAKAMELAGLPGLVTGRRLPGLARTGGADAIKRWYDGLPMSSRVEVDRIVCEAACLMMSSNEWAAAAALVEAIKPVGDDLTLRHQVESGYKDWDLAKAKAAVIIAARLPTRVDFAVIEQIAEIQLKHNDKEGLADTAAKAKLILAIPRPTPQIHPLAVPIDPDEKARAILQRAQISFWEGNNSAAAESLKEFAGLNPSTIYLLEGQVRLQVLLNDRARAGETLARIKQTVASPPSGRSPGDVLTCLARGQLCLGDADGLAETYKQVATGPYLFANFCEAVAREADTPERYKIVLPLLVNRGKDRPPQVGAVFVAAAEAGDLDAALPLMQPDDIEAIHRMIKARTASKDSAGAKRIAQRAVELVKAASEAKVKQELRFQLLAESLVDDGFLDEAAAVAEKLLAGVTSYHSRSFEGHEERTEFRKTAVHVQAMGGQLDRLLAWADKLDENSRDAVLTEAAEAVLWTIDKPETWEKLREE